jgi:hypothetical protein
MKNDEISALDNKTIAKLAIAIATAIQLKEDGEVIGPLARKVLETLDTLDSLEHFSRGKPGVH